MKKLISFILVFSLIITVPVFAKESTKLNLDERNLKENIKTLQDIDVYLTEANDTFLEKVTTTKIEELNKVLPKYNLENKNIYNGINNIIKLESKQKQTLINKRILDNTIEQIEVLQEKNIKVKSVNVILPVDSSENILQSKSSEDDFYNISKPWGYSDGFNFRYFYTSIEVESGEVDLVDKYGTNAVSILGRNLVEFAVSEIIGSALGDLATYLDLLSNIFSDFSNLNVTIDTANEEKLCYNFDGVINYKNIVIEDIDNKIDGYTYYPWGFISKINGNQNYRHVYNVEEPGGSLKRKTEYTEGEDVDEKTSGFSDAFNVFDNTIEYYNYLGYHQYIEEINYKINFKKD